MKKLVGLCVLLVSVSALADSKKALVLDADSKSVTVIDAASGSVGERVTLSDTPLRMVLSPDGKRIAVLSRGEGTTSFWTSHFNPTTKSSVTFIDGSAMKPIARVELGWDVGRATFSSDGGTLTVLTPGVASNKPAEVRAAELIRVSAKSGEVLKRLALDRAAESFEVSSDGATGAVFFKAANQKPAEVRLTDVSSLDTIATIPLSNSTEAPVALIRDRLYLVDGKDAKSAKAYVVSLSDRRLEANLDVGDRPIVGAVDPERGNIYLLNFDGELRIVNGTSVSPPVAVGKHPEAIRFSDDKKIGYVVSNVYLTTVDLTKMTASQPIRIDNSASDFIASPDGRRGFVLHRSEQMCCRATVVDLTNNTQMKSFMTGSKGKRIGQGLGAVALSLASFSSARSAAASRGGGTFYYSVYTPRIAKAARGPLAIRPDGKFAYYLDPQTSDVTVVDGESGERLKNIGIGKGAKELTALSNGKYVAAVSDESVTIVDTDMNDMKSEVTLSGDVADFVVSSTGDYAAVIGKGKIAVIDARNASQVATFEAFKKPVQFIFIAD
jgi:DNA-binding beta-propeller fold protein YncE